MNIVELTVRRFLFIIQKYSSNKVESASSSDLATELVIMAESKMPLAAEGYHLEIYAYFRINRCGHILPPPPN